MKRSFAGILFLLIALPVIWFVPPIFSGADAIDREDRVLVVMKPPQRFSQALAEYGYVIDGTSELKELSIKVVKVYVPDGETLEAAEEKLIKRFPNLIIGNIKFIEIKS